jgi:hypothetical protein
MLLCLPRYINVYMFYKSFHRSTLSARVSLSDLRIPLIWKEIDHFKHRGDHRRYAVFCLAKIGTQIFDTTLVNPVDASCTDICFDDVLIL